MPSLKDLRNRIASVRATRKITQAMRMVAASKLRRAQDAAAAARPYADRLAAMLDDLALGVAPDASPLIGAREHPDGAVAMVIVAAADRGLCGGFNASIVRAARAHADRLVSAGMSPVFLCVGRKAHDAVRRIPGARLFDDEPFPAHPTPDLAQRVADRVRDAFNDNSIATCDLVYAQFVSALSQRPIAFRLAPAGDPIPTSSADATATPPQRRDPVVYDAEPSPEEALHALLERNLAAQILRALLENTASEHGARMTAMDAATRNAGDMIDRLALTYNRARQAMITKELVEVISGAEAV